MSIPTVSYYRYADFVKQFPNNALSCRMKNKRGNWVCWSLLFFFLWFCGVFFPSVSFGFLYFNVLGLMLPLSTLYDMVLCCLLSWCTGLQITLSASYCSDHGFFVFLYNRKNNQHRHRVRWMSTGRKSVINPLENRSPVLGTNYLKFE